MRTTHRFRIMAGGATLALALITGLGGCESGQSSRQSATAGPSPSWVEQFHREQLRHEYERQKYEEEVLGR